jgi:hypothetical protein
LNSCFIYLSQGTDLTNLVGSPLWEQFKLYELTEIMRQRDDRTFAQALNNLAAGCLSQEEIQLFRSKCVHREEALPIEAKEAIHLYSTNAEVDTFNTLKLQTIPGDIIDIEAIDSTTGHGPPSAKQMVLTKMRQMTTSETFGLPQKLSVKLGVRVMLTKNIDIEDGLFNGATGLLKNIENISNQVNILWVKFDLEEIGQKLRQNWCNYQQQNNIQPDLTPIQKDTAQVSVQSSGSINGVRKQFPIVVAEAITIHKSQGQTMSVVVVGLGQRYTRNSCYVAFSRSTTLHGLHIIGGFNPPRAPPPTHPVVLEMEKLRQNPLITKFQHLSLTPPNNCIKIIFFNIQSLNKHLDDLKVDTVFTSADIILLAETWTLPSDVIDLPEFSEVARQNCLTSPRSANGTTIFCHQNLQPFITSHSSKGQNFISRKTSTSSVKIHGITITSVYKTPQTTLADFKRFICTVIEPLDPKKIVCGDFNYNNNHQFVLFMERTFNLKLLPTPPTTKFNTTIDLVFVGPDINIKMIEIYESIFSYHKPIVMIVEK